MTSGYMDAGTGPEGLRFRLTDLVIFLISVEMAWVFDPIATAAAAAGGLDTSQPWWLSNHRWYLLAMLLCRLAAVLLHGFRVPPFAQILLAACALFLLPAGMVCISAACSNSIAERKTLQLDHQLSQSGGPGSSRRSHSPEGWCTNATYTSLLRSRLPWLPQRAKST